MLSHSAGALLYRPLFAAEFDAYNEIRWHMVTRGCLASWSCAQHPPNQGGFSALPGDSLRATPMSTAE